MLNKNEKLFDCPPILLFFEQLQKYIMIMRLKKFMQKFSMETLRKSLNYMTGRCIKYATYIWTTQNKQ